MSHSIAQPDLSLPADVSPIGELLRLALPTVAQMASYTVMQFIDRWMLASVSDLHAAAAGTAGITFFCFIGFGFGLLFVVNTMVSQNFGRGHLQATGPAMWQGVWFGVIFGAAMIGIIPIAHRVFAAMGHAPAVVDLESSYIKIVALTGWAKLATIATSQFLLGLQRPTVVFAATLAGVFVNTVLNWVLIFGHFGFAPMGLVGSAWGLNGGVLCELLVMAVYILRPIFIRAHGVADWRIHWGSMRTLLAIGVPSGFQLICDITAWTIFMNVILGSFGTAALAANSFAFTYMHLCFMPALGVGGAVTALVGKYIGMGRYDLAERRAHLGFFVCAAYMMVAGAVLIWFRFNLIGLFSADPEVQKIGATILVFVGLYQLFDAMFLIYVSALRGAGDTLLPSIVQGALVWSIVVGGGFLIVRYAPQYGVVGPWSVSTVFGAILGLFLLTRFKLGHWKTIRLDLPDGSNVGDTSAKLTALTEP